MAGIIKPLTSLGLGVVSNADDIVDSGLYVYNMQKPMSNVNGNIGSVFQMKGADTRYLYQLNCATEGDGTMYLRSKDSNGWHPWQRIDNYGYNSFAELSAGVASEMATKTQEVTIPAGGSVEIAPTSGYAVFSITSSSATSVIVGAISGSTVHEIFRYQSSKLVVEKAESWGTFKITNTGTSTVVFYVHILY